MRCHYCESPNVRNSHLRLADLPRLSLLQYPVRCHSCEGRFFGTLWGALKLRTAAKARRDERRRKESESA